MPPKKANLIVLLVITLLISLICLVFHGYHAQVHCFTQAGDSMTHECGDGVPENCIAGYAISAFQSHSGVNMKFSITCPFSTFPTAFGLLGFIFAIIFVIIFHFTTREKVLGAHIAAFGSLIIGLLSSSLILMIGDVMKGAELAKDGDTIEFFSPSSFVTHIILVLIGIVLISFLTFYGYQLKRGIRCSGTLMMANPKMHQGNELSQMAENVIGGLNMTSISKKGFVIFD